MGDKGPSNVHDHFFKEVFSRKETASNLIERFLPAEVVRILDLSSLESSKGSFVDPELREHYSDLLYRVDIRGGGAAYVYVLFEHKSYPDRQVAFQVLRYMVRIWEHMVRQGERLVPIIPMVVYHGLGRWRVGDSFGELLNSPEELKAFQPDYRYQLLDLSRYSDEELKSGVLRGVHLLLLKYILRPDLREHVWEIFSLMEDLLAREDGLEWLEVMIRYLSQATDRITEEELREAVESVFAEEGGRIMGTIAEKWVEQGLEQGIKQGLDQGLAEGFRKGLLSGIEMGLELRFGSAGLKLLPEIYRVKNVAALQAIHEGLKTASSLEELREIYLPYVEEKDGDD